jgi:high affinity sulfate transporter 1
VIAPHTAVLGKIPDTNIYRNVLQYPDATRIPGILLVRIDAAIYFANTNYIVERWGFC